MFASKDTLLTRPSGYNIARSVRLRSSASGYFSRTPSASSRTTWTWTAWVKRGKLGSAQALFSAGTGTAEFRLTFTSSDTIEIYEYTSPSYNWQKITTAVYRDPSAWYQIQLVYDTTNGTAGDRVKLYVNSVQVTSFGTNTNPTPSFSGYVNSAVVHGIGSFSTGGSYLDGYLTEINFIDGQALTPSSFGETDSITGVWKPKAYSGTYGTNGFELNFSDNSNNTAATIGKDYSGNGNNWTPNNISVTAGATYDSMTDVPTLTSATVANYCVLNPNDVSAIASSNGYATNGNLKWSNANGGAQATIRATMGVSSGKWYWETTCTTFGGSNPDTGILLASNTLVSADQFVGNYAGGYSYGGNGQKRNNNTGAAYGATYTTGDVIGVALDMDAGTLTFYKNNTSQGTAYSSLSGTFSPAVSNYLNGVWDANFGQRPFSYTPPTGFVALNTYNLPASTIKNGAAYMAATLYTGNGSTQTVSNAVNGVSFQPDLVWIKGRSSANQDHTLVDSVRGVSRRIRSNQTVAEVLESGFTVTAFNSSGFTAVDDTNGAYNVNGSIGGTFSGAAAYVAWNWKAGGTSASNTNGSITSTVSVGATQGFSVVTYTGTGIAATIGHGLGVAPSMIIIKSRPTASTSWIVYHSSISPTNLLTLQTTAAQQNLPLYFNSTSPTSSVFSIGSAANTGVDLNVSSSTYVAYCFSAVAGYSAFGSFSGNGSADGPFVYTSFRPRWIMWKNTSLAGTDWTIVDSSRNTYNVANSGLQPNGSYAEASNSNYQIDFLSNGFKVRTTNPEANRSGDTIIYACFAESPFKTSLAR